MTYQTAIGVRYPELVTVNPTGCTFGRFVPPGRLLDRSNCLTSPHLPPLVIAEALQDYVSHWYKIRRLHLIVVDTWSPWQYNTGQVRAVTDLMKHLADTPEMQRMIP